MKIVSTSFIRTKLKPWPILFSFNSIYFLAIVHLPPPVIFGLYYELKARKVSLVGLVHPNKAHGLYGNSHLKLAMEESSFRN